MSTAGERQKGKRERVPSAYVLPSNRHPFAAHFEVLRRFDAATRNGEGVPASRVEGNGVPAQSASLNVRWLRSIGLLVPTQRGMYAPTELARRFVSARTINDQKAAPILAEALAGKWFTETMQSAFQSKPVMTDDEFISELAWAAQTHKDKEEPALRVILEYMLYAGLVTRDERGLSWSSGAATRPMPSQTVPEAVGAGTGVPSSPHAERMASEVPGWHILSTEDFYVKVKSDLDVVQDLIDYLEPLKRKIMRLRQAVPKAEVAPSENQPSGP